VIGNNMEMVNYMRPAVKRSQAKPRAYKHVIKNSILVEELKAFLRKKREIKHLDKLNELMVTHITTRWQTLEDIDTLLQQKLVWYDNKIKELQQDIEDKIKERDRVVEELRLLGIEISYEANKRDELRDLYSCFRTMTDRGLSLGDEDHLGQGLC
jgi:hypothetical protein